MQTNCNHQPLLHAGFFVRLAAFAIDSLLSWVILLVVRGGIGLFLFFAGVQVMNESILFHYSLSDIILYALKALYFILLTYYTGSTVGKRLLNIKVVSAKGPKLMLADVIYRETIGRFLCGLSIGIGYIMAGIDREKRGIHDIICDTRVIYEKRIRTVPDMVVNRPPAPSGPVSQQLSKEGIENETRRF